MDELKSRLRSIKGVILMLQIRPLALLEDVLTSQPLEYEGDWEKTKQAVMSLMTKKGILNPQTRKEILEVIQEYYF